MMLDYSKVDFSFKQLPQNGYGYIYAYKFDNGKYYVGQTKYSIWTRYLQHANENKGIVKNAIKKHSHELLLLDCVVYEKMDDLEIEYIKKYNSEYPNGYNLTNGGSARQIISDETRKKISDGLKKYHREHPITDGERKRRSLCQIGRHEYSKTEEFRKFISDINKGRNMSEEGKRKISQSLKGKYTGENNWSTGRKLTEQHKEKCSQSLKGHIVTQETRHKISKARLGMKMSDDAKRKMSENNTRKIKVICVETGKIYDSLTEASKDNNVTKQSVKHAIDKGTKSNGYHWKKYKE